jgi:hypothetical protein
MTIEDFKNRFSGVLTQNDNETTFNVNLKISGADNYANLLATTMQKDPSMKDQVVAAINEPIRSYLANA